ncbi:RloB family protein [Rothia nasimurium]|uniref:RloB family protein n=1 Tax=Rothia nasimurium TaxID=85336 RepID=UPI001F312F42|nr:RloB family protein [Rothia nasimurium]
MARKNKFSRGIRAERKPRGQSKIEGKRFLVVTEGVLTEPQYFERLQQLPQFQRVQIITDPRPRKNGKGANVSRGSDPVSVINACANKKSTDKSSYSGYFCVVDVDHYNTRVVAGSPSTLEQALKIAQEQNVDVVVSHCSFEFWLECHLVNKKKLQMGGDKSIKNDFPIERFQEACEVADRRAINAQDRKVEFNEIGPNPSTSMPRLIEKFLN